jgi:hypothetical protein
MFETKVVEKIKVHILRSAAFFPKILLLWDNVKSLVRGGKATDDNKIRHMCFACWIT